VILPITATYMPWRGGGQQCTVQFASPPVVNCS